MELQNGYPVTNIKGNLGYGSTKVKTKITPKEKFISPSRICVAWEQRKKTWSGQRNMVGSPFEKLDLLLVTGSGNYPLL